jgi:hypothetical protein
MNSVQGTWELPQVSFLIRRSPDQRSFASFPEHIAGYHVLLRFSMPRHPPYTLKSLTTFIDHRHAAGPRPSEPKPCGPAGRAGRRQPGRALPDRQRINNRQKGARRRPTDRKTKARVGDPPSQGRASRRSHLLLDEPSVEPQESFTCQRTLISLLRRLLAAVQSISFPPNAGESAVGFLT